ncbi:hypothetical protein HYU21_04590 [Candidatus Woesearchaeota archaeon]|nr:hypothetical protein [Candidatus Woesearchaeota archaeon]
MLKKDELKILKLLLDDLTNGLTIMDVSRQLNQKYVQTYRTVKNMVVSGDILIKFVGKSKVLKLNLSALNSNYLFAEMERANDICRKNKYVAVVKKNIEEINRNFICIVFGSQTEQYKPKSDVDLLFVIPKEYNHEEFEKTVKQHLIATNVDVTIVFESSLHEMWSNPLKLNVGNELLKKHIILYGAEHFLNLLRKHYVG